MPDIEGGEHVVVYRAVADFRQLLAEVAKAKAELKALSGDTAAAKTGNTGATEKLKRDIEAYTRARVDGANRVGLAEYLADQRVAKNRVDGERQVEQAAQKTVKAEQASLDLQKAAVDAEKALAAAKDRTAEAEARHAKQSRELSNARAAVGRAQGALADRPTGPHAAEDSELHALQQRLAEATARAVRAETDRDATGAALRSARGTQKAAEKFVAASQVEQIPIQPPSTKRHPKPLPEVPALGKDAEAAAASQAARDITEIRRRIIKAYAEAIGDGAVHGMEDGDFVDLSRLRARLTDLERHAVDQQLKELYRDPGTVNLVPENNQKTLTQARRDASVNIGDQDKHLISMNTEEAYRRLSLSNTPPPQPQKQETAKPREQERAKGLPREAGQIADAPAKRRSGIGKDFDVDEVLREFKAALTKDEARSLLSRFSRAELTEVAKKEQLPRAGNAIPDAPLPKTQAALTEHLVHQVREARPEPTGPVHDPTHVDPREFVDKVTGHPVPQPSQVDVVRGRVVPTPTMQTPAATETTPKAAATVDDLTKMSIPQLRDEARRRGLTELEGNRKDDLLAGLIAHTKTGSAPTHRPLPAAPPVLAPEASAIPESTKVVIEHDVNTIRHRIVQAYEDLIGKGAEPKWVSMTRLRPPLSDIPRAQVDEQLRQMAQTVNLVPESNQKMLTPEDRAAAVVQGDQQKHHVWMDPDEVRRHLTPIAERQADVTEPKTSRIEKPAEVEAAKPEPAKPEPAKPAARRVRSGRVPTADDAAALTREDLNEAIAKFSDKSATGKVLRDESLRRAHNAILGSAPDAGLHREPGQPVPAPPAVEPAKPALPRGRIPTAEQAAALSREDLEEAVAKFSAKSGTGKVVREELARRASNATPVPAAPTPEPEQTPAPKPPIRRRPIPADQIAVLSREELNEHLRNYPPTTKTGKLLADESLRRGHAAILNSPPATPAALSAAPTPAAPAAAQPGHDADPAERALAQATTETNHAEQKLTAAREKVADQEELLSDAKHEYLVARGDAQRVREEVQRAATRSGIEVTPEQLATNKRVRTADEALRAAQGPVRDTHTDLEAARAAQATAERELETAKAAEAAAKANAEAAGRSERAAASSAVAAEAAGSGTSPGHAETKPAWFDDMLSLLTEQGEQRRHATATHALDAAPTSRLTRAEQDAAEAAESLARAQQELETRTLALADAEDRLDRAHAEQAPTSSIFDAEDTHRAARADVDSARQAALSAQAADATARTEVRTASTASRPEPQHALSAAPTPRPAPSDFRDFRRELGALRPAQAAAAPVSAPRQAPTPPTPDLRIGDEFRRILGSLRQDVDATGKELEVFRRPVREVGAEAVQVQDRMRHFEEGLDRVNRGLGVARATYDDVNVKTKVFADRVNAGSAVLEEEFQALRHFQDGLSRTEGVLKGRANQPALQSATTTGTRNFETFARSVLDEVDKRPQHQIASGPTGATASYFESLDRNVRRVNQDLETRSVARFNEGLDKVTGDLRQKFLADIQHVAADLRASIVGTAEEFDRFTKSIDDVDHRLQSNFRDRPPAVPRQTDQDILRRQPAIEGGTSEGQGRGVVAMRRDDLERFIQEIKKVHDEPNFAPREGTHDTTRARQQEFVDEGREHRRFRAEGELFDDRPPYEPFRRQLPSGIGMHDTLHAPSEYPGSKVGAGAFDPRLAADRAAQFGAREFTGQASRRFARFALEGPPQRQPFLAGSVRDTLRTKRYKAETKKVRSFPNAVRATRDAFMGDTGGGLTGAFRDTKGLGEFKNRLTDIADVVPKLTGQFGYWEKIIIAVVTAVVALIPAIATLTAGVGALLSAGAAAGAGLAIFGLAAVGVFGRLKTAIDDNAKSGRAIPAAYQEAASAFKTLKSAYSQFLNATQGDVLGVFTQGLRLATTQVGRFVPIVHAVAGALQGVVGQIGAATKTDTFARFLNFVGSTGSRAITSFARTLLLFGQGLAELAMAFGPYISTILRGVQGLAQSFERFGASRSGSNSFKQFMQYAIENAPKVGEFLEQLVRAVGHLGAALAPLGGNLFTVANLLLKLVNAIPTSALAGIVQGFVLVWSSIRLFLGLVAVIKLVTKFYEAMNLIGRLAQVQGVITALSQVFPRLGAAMASATGAGLSFKGMVIGLVASSVILVALTVALNVVFDAVNAWGNANDAAAASADRHKTALAELADQLQQTNGAVTQATRTYEAGKLQQPTEVDIKDEAPGIGGSIAALFGHAPTKKVTASVAEEATKAGIDPASLTSAALGDADAKKGVDTKLQSRIDTLRQQRTALQKQMGIDATKGHPDDPAALKNLNKEVEAATAGKKAFDDLAVSSTELGDAQKNTAALVGNLTTLIDSNLGPTATLTERYRALIGILSKNDKSTVIDQAVQALDTYNEALKEQVRAQEAMGKANLDAARSIQDAQQRITSASQALVEAQQNEVVAQENLRKAREDAAAQLEDYRRTLRDIPLDEEQNSINLQKAIDDERKSRAAPGATGLDRRQAQLDLKRAQNTSSDTLIDDQRKRTDANIGLTKTVETSDNVIAAKNALTDATTALGNANQELKRSMEDLPFVQQAAKNAIADAQQAFDVATQKVNDTGRALADAAGNAGVTADQLKNIKAQQQQLERDITLHLGLDTGTTLADLKEIAIAQEAIQLMVGPPPMSYDKARTMAASIVAASTHDTAATQAFSGGPTKLHQKFFAAGGAVEGPGTATSDSVPIRASTGEHMWTAAEVVAVGGHTMVKAIRDAALHRKSAATTPERYHEAAGLLRAAAVPGRSNTGTDPARLSAAMFTAGLNVAAATVPGGAPVATAARAVVVDNSVHHNGVSTGDITINNPVQEKAGGSLYHSIRRLRRDYD